MYSHWDPSNMDYRREVEWYDQKTNVNAKNNCNLSQNLNNFLENQVKLKSVSLLMINE